MSNHSPVVLLLRHMTGPIDVVADTVWTWRRAENSDVDVRHGQIVQLLSAPAKWELPHVIPNDEWNWFGWARPPSPPRSFVQHVREDVSSTELPMCEVAVKLQVGWAGP